MGQSFLLAPGLLQAQQVQAEADRQVAHLTTSIQQAQSQAAALSVDKERLHAQLLQQQQAAAAGPAVGVPGVPAIPQVSFPSIAPTRKYWLP